MEHSDGLTHDKTVQCSSYPKACKKKKGASIYIYAKKAARCFGTSIEWDMALGLSQHEALLLYIYIYIDKYKLYIQGRL